MPPESIDAIMQVMDRAFDPAFGEAWTRRQVADALLLASTHCLLADPVPRPVLQPAANAPLSRPPEVRRACGFALSRQAADEEELLLIGVLPEERGQGIGSGLLERLFDEAHGRGSRRLFLEMREGNPAERLYRKLGFTPIGRRRAYYRAAASGPVDAITFARSL